MESEFEAFAEESLEWAQAAWPLAQEVWPRDDHEQNSADPSFCVCGVAGLWETPDRWVCYRTAERVPSPPPSLTRGGFMYGH